MCPRDIDAGLRTLATIQCGTIITIFKNIEREVCIRQSRNDVNIDECKIERKTSMLFIYAFYTNNNSQMFIVHVLPTISASKPLSANNSRCQTSPTMIFLSYVTCEM